MPGRTGWGHDLTTRKQTRLSGQVLARSPEQNAQPPNKDHNIDIDHKTLTVQRWTTQRAWFMLLTPARLPFLSWVAQTLLGFFPGLLELPLMGVREAPRPMEQSTTDLHAIKNAVIHTMIQAIAFSLQIFISFPPVWEPCLSSLSTQGLQGPTQCLCRIGP